MSELLRIYKCDFLCLQELWCLDETLYRLGSISTDYMYTAISGVDSGHHILQGKPHGGVGILYKKCLAKYVSHIKSVNRRVCAVKITTDNDFTWLIVSAYLPVWYIYGYSSASVFWNNLLYWIFD